MDLVGMISSLGVWAQTHSTAVVCFFGATVVLLLLASLVDRDRPPPPTHGSARLAQTQDLRRAGLLVPEGVVLGRHGAQVLWAGKLHVLLCAPSGSGKDVGHNFPTTLRWPHSMIINDIKDHGENYRICGRARRGPHGAWPVYRFAPTIVTSHCFNVLDTVRVGYPEEFRDAALIAESHVASAAKAVHRTDSGQFFQFDAYTTIRAGILHVLYGGGGRSMAGVLAALNDSAKCLAAMAKSRQAVVRAFGQSVQAIQQEAPRQFYGVWRTAQQALDLYQDPLIAAHTSTSDFRLTDLQYGAHPMTLYLGANAPTEMPYLAPIFRSVLQVAAERLMEMPDLVERRELLWLLNEFSSLGYMRVLEELPDTARAYRMRFLVATQSPQQLFGTYGLQTPLWESLGTKIFHRPTTPETAHQIAQWLGEQTILVRSESTGRGGHKTVSKHPHGRKLLTEAEILDMENEQLLIFSPECACPILAHKIRYYQDRF